MIKRYENVERMLFDGVGEYDIPVLDPVIFSELTEFISSSRNNDERPCICHGKC